MLIYGPGRYLLIGWLSVHGECSSYYFLMHFLFSLATQGPQWIQKVLKQLCKKVRYVWARHVVVIHLEQGFLTVNETTDVAVRKLVHPFYFWPWILPSQIVLILWMLGDRIFNSCSGIWFGFCPSDDRLGYGGAESNKPRRWGKGDRVTTVSSSPPNDISPSERKTSHW